MLTLLSDKEINQLHAHLTELTSVVENLTFILGGAQTIAVDTDKPASPRLPLQQTAKPKSQSKTRKSRPGKRGVSVLTEKKVAEIKRQLKVGGKSVSKIAREFGVHSTTINCIKWGKTWKNVAPAAEKTLEITEIRA